MGYAGRMAGGLNGPAMLCAEPSGCQFNIRESGSPYQAARLDYAALSIHSDRN
jgi:hypothetical protein